MGRARIAVVVGAVAVAAIAFFPPWTGAARGAQGQPLHPALGHAPVWSSGPTAYDYNGGIIAPTIDWNRLYAMELGVIALTAAAAIATRTRA